MELDARAACGGTARDEKAASAAVWVDVVGRLLPSQAPLPVKPGPARPDGNRDGWRSPPGDASSRGAGPRAAALPRSGRHRSLRNFDRIDPGPASWQDLDFFILVYSKSPQSGLPAGHCFSPAPGWPAGSTRRSGLSNGPGERGSGASLLSPAGLPPLRPG